MAIASGWVGSNTRWGVSVAGCSRRKQIPRSCGSSLKSGCSQMPGRHPRSEMRLASKPTSPRAPPGRISAALSAPRSGKPRPTTQMGRLAVFSDRSDSRLTCPRVCSRLQSPAWLTSHTKPYTGCSGTRRCVPSRPANRRADSKGSSHTWPDRDTTLPRAMGRSPGSTGQEPLRTSIHRSTPKGSTCQWQKAPAPVCTPTPCVCCPSYAKKYQGICRSGTSARHSRSPSELSQAPHR